MHAELKALFSKDALNLMLKCVTENVNFFVPGLLFILKNSANEKNLQQNPTLEEPLISIENLETHINRKHIANDMTPKPSNDIKYFESKHRYQHHSRAQVPQQHGPDNNVESAQYYIVCKYCRKNGHSISRFLKRQTNHYRNKFRIQKLTLTTIS